MVSNEKCYLVFTFERSKLKIFNNIGKNQNKLKKTGNINFLLQIDTVKVVHRNTYSETGKWIIYLGRNLTKYGNIYV